MALRDGYDPANDPPVELYVYALRHFGPNPETMRCSGPSRGKPLGRKATHVRHVLRELAVYADWESMECYPDQERLAAALAVTRPSVSETIQDAQAIGWLASEKKNPPGQRAGRGWAVNRYRLVLPPDVREMAEADAVARRESRQATAPAPRVPSLNPLDGRRESRRAPRDGRRENPGGRRENRSEDVGKADTNSSVELFREHRAGVCEHTQEKSAPSDEHFDPVASIREIRESLQPGRAAS